MQQNDSDKQIQQRILQVFKYVVSFLKQHQLHYVACGGTVLGAVRHQDFIPWDDDIDIYMPRPDYDRLLKLQSEVWKDGYEVLSLQEDKNYYLPFMKISDRHTTLWEVKELPYIMGVYVDVFPLDYFDCSDDELTASQLKAEKMFFHYFRSMHHMTTWTLWKDILKGDFDTADFKFQVMCLRPFRRLLRRRLLNYQKQESLHSGDKAVCVTQWPGRIFKREWFEDTIEQPFGDTTVTIPRDYDGYLTCLYGDYMTLPPVEQRVSNHFHYYLNFDERLSLDEVRRIKR